MYICPICGKEFNTEDIVAKHYLKCWKKEHPYHKSKSAPQSENITTREMNDEVFNFFNSFQDK